jgi:alkylhydroperoxidase/carboxymuconolactone decarboxylase family protein YurZ
MMNEKTDVMIALAAAIGANCIPCFDNLFERAKGLGVSNEEVLKIVETANKVKTGASIFLKNAVNDTMGLKPETDQPCCAGAKRACC